MPMYLHQQSLEELRKLFFKGESQTGRIYIGFYQMAFLYVLFLVNPKDKKAMRTRKYCSIF